MTEYRFYVKYNKSCTNPQGGVEITVSSFNDRNGNLDQNAVLENKPRVYKIKSNAISVLSVTSPKASFTSKANISEIINGVEQSIEGNCTLQMDMIDGLNATTYDQLAVTIYRKAGGVWYSSYWDGTRTVLNPVCGSIPDQLSVTGTGVTTPAARINTNAPTQVNVIPAPTLIFDLKAYPNPTTSHFNVKLESSIITQPITLNVVDVSGKLVEVRKNLVAGQTFQLGANYRPGMYFVELLQGDSRRIVKLVKQPD